MQTLNYTIKDENGIHARPAGNLVKLAANFESEITVTKDGKSANMKRLFSLMSLCIKKGDEITVTVNGGDEVQAAEGIRNFLHENL